MTDRVRFIMPQDRELQFPAMAILQSFVRDYDARARAQNYTRGEIKYKLVYDVEMSPEDVEYWRTAGNPLKLDCERFPGTPDSVVDWSTERLESFRDSGKNAWQICNILSGCQTNQIFPEIRRVVPRIDTHEWCDTGGEVWRWLTFPEQSMLTCVRDDEITGIVGCASSATYLAASMGLGVIEILPEGREPFWQAKWGSPYYRMIPAGAANMEEMIARAKDSVLADMRYVRALENKRRAESGK